MNQTTNNSTYTASDKPDMATKVSYKSVHHPATISNNPYMTTNESYMTINEFCTRMQVSTSTAYRMIKSRQIPAIKFGRRYKIPRSIFDKLNSRFF